MSAHSGWRAQPSRGIAPRSVSTFCPARGPSKQPEAEPSNQLKSDEAAGDGPGNGLVAGTVTQDYTDQKAVPAGRIDGGGDDAAARLAAQSFAASTTRALNDFRA
jgi:hypothetical protein